MYKVALTSSGAMFIFLLQKAGGKCPRKAISYVMGHTCNVEHLLTECAVAGLIKADPHTGAIHLIQQPDEYYLLTRIMQSPVTYATESVAHAISCHLKKIRATSCNLLFRSYLPVTVAAI